MLASYGTGLMFAAHIADGKLVTALFVVALVGAVIAFALREFIAGAVILLVAVLILLLL